MKWLISAVASFSLVALAVTGCATVTDPEAVADSIESDLTSCCVSARNGNDCWRKCDGRWKDLLSNETCALARGDGGCVAEFRPGGGCWRKCDGRWKDRLPSEEVCQVNACGSTSPSGSGSHVTLHTFAGCDDFFTVATLTPDTNCSDVWQGVQSVKKDGVCSELPFGMSAEEACRLYKPLR